MSIHEDLRTHEDPHDLARFVAAQDGVFERALAELRDGCKRTHWMWFVFPQIRGLGRSGMAQRYALAGLDEARAYLAHPLLGPRLQACTQAVLGHPRLPLARLFGAPDDMKFLSSMTLFAQAAGSGSVFAQALQVHGRGCPDEATLRILRAQALGSD